MPHGPLTFVRVLGRRSYARGASRSRSIVLRRGHLRRCESTRAGRGQPLTGARTRERPPGGVGARARLRGATSLARVPTIAGAIHTGILVVVLLLLASASFVLLELLLLLLALSLLLFLVDLDLLLLLEQLERVHRLLVLQAGQLRVYLLDDSLRHGGGALVSLGSNVARRRREARWVVDRDDGRQVARTGLRTSRIRGQRASRTGSRSRGGAGRRLDDQHLADVGHLVVVDLVERLLDFEHRRQIHQLAGHDGIVPELELHLSFRGGECQLHRCLLVLLGRRRCHPTGGRRRRCRVAGRTRELLANLLSRRHRHAQQQRGLQMMRRHRGRKDARLPSRRSRKAHEGAAGRLGLDDSEWE